MILKCWKCKSADGEEVEPNKVELLLAKVLPLTPFRCTTCERKYYGLISPLFDRSRMIAAGVFGGLAIVALVLAFVGPAEPEPVPKAARSETVAETEPPESNPPSKPSSAEPDTASEADPLAVDGATAQPRYVDPILSGDPPESKPQPGEVWSDRVSTQVAQNLVKLRTQANTRGEKKPRVEAAKPSEKRNLAVVSDAPKPKSSEPAVAQDKRGNDAAPPRRAPEVAAPVEPAQQVPGPTTSQTEPARSISAIEPLAEGTSYSLRIVADGPISAAKSFVSSGKYVVDLPGSWTVARRVKDLICNHALVKQIRFGKHADYVRLVFDLNGSDPVDLTFAETSDGLKVTLSPGK